MADLDRIRAFVGSIPKFAQLLIRLARDPRVPRRNKAVFGAIALYLLFPLDFVPDWVPGLGQLDDILLVVLALDTLLNRVSEEVVLDHWDGDPAALAGFRNTLATATMLVPDRVRRWLSSRELEG